MESVGPPAENATTIAIGRAGYVCAPAPSAQPSSTAKRIPRESFMAASSVIVTTGVYPLSMASVAAAGPYFFLGASGCFVPARGAAVCWVGALHSCSFVALRSSLPDRFATLI